MVMCYSTDQHILKEYCFHWELKKNLKDFQLGMLSKSMYFHGSWEISEESTELKPTK